MTTAQTHVAISRSPPHVCFVFLTNDSVAGFIGPEVFRTKEQLVRCCLEDTVMGKLHGLTIGLDICSTLHMDVTLDDLDWCIDNVMVSVKRLEISQPPHRRLTVFYPLLKARQSRLFDGSANQKRSHVELPHHFV